MSRTRIAALVAVGVAAVIGLTAALVIVGKDGDAAGGASGTCRDSASTRVPQPTGAQLAAAGLARLPLASDDARVDLVAPPFSNPTEVSNPLFPIGSLRSALLNGTVDGQPFRTETTLLPETRIMEWSEGQCVEVLVSQYTAYLGGRIHEVALDLYAQADDGSVWYFGEDVFNYEDGVIADTAGTWFAGIEGPAAMIMPGEPKVGDAYRPENIAGFVFEEVTVKAVGRTVAGPRGPVQGAITTRELHDDGTTEEKTFAPGYGEFFTSGGGDVEALALAVPTDALSGGVPPALEKLSSGADDVFVAASAGGRLWSQASPAPSRMSDAWATHRRTGDVPPRLVAPTNEALRNLARRVAGRDRAGSRQAALDAAQAVLDLQLQYRPVAEIDLGRFDIWLRQVVLDAQARAHGALLGDVSTLEWMRDRIEKALDPVDLTRLDTLLKELRTNAGDEDFAGASETAVEMRKLLA
ncbi:MAG: hypothetical protein M3P42_08350 [Actinomycetota bacterium]|nr:hypothetical protein [Actinomycetota bacterium]